MCQKTVLAIIKKYPEGVMRKDVEKEYVNCSDAIFKLYKKRFIIRKKVKGGFKYWAV